MQLPPISPGLGVCMPCRQRECYRTCFLPCKYRGTTRVVLRGWDCVSSVSTTAPIEGIGNPDEVRANLEPFEEVGVDQVVFIRQ